MPSPGGCSHKPELATGLDIAFEKYFEAIVNTPTYRILLYFNCLKVLFKPIEGL